MIPDARRPAEDQTFDSASARERLMARPAAATGVARLRSGSDLARDQLNAIDDWYRDYRSGLQATAVATRSREERLDARRRLEARRREHAALIQQAQRRFDVSNDVLSLVAVRAVVVHRQPWFRDRVVQSLRRSRVAVLATFDDGADAAGAIVVEQPDVVLVEAQLPSLCGSDLVERIQAFSARTVVGVQVPDADHVDSFAGLGVHAVFTRRVPPADVAEQLLLCAGDGRHVVLA